MSDGLNVLSLFDGMSCGRVALERAGIPVSQYFASEIDRFAMQISCKNYPDIVQMGDVKHVHALALPSIDLLLGGSPCQGFSFAGKQLAFDDPRSALFFEFVRLLKEVKPKYFLLENVRMKKEHQAVITEALGVEPININSNLVSAQNRNRFYWTNIPNVTQPEYKGLVIEDILENGESELYQRGRGNNPGGVRTGKSPSMTANSWEHNVLVPVVKSHGELIYKPHKSQCLDANYHKGPDNHGQRTGLIELGHAQLKCHEERKRVYSPAGKSPAILAASGGYHEKKIAVDAKRWRKLTPLECERLQTLPDNYTEGVSNTQRYKMIGNGWTIDVISHILKNLIDKEIFKCQTD